MGFFSVNVKHGLEKDSQIEVYSYSKANPILER
jgi:hypothetical protein